MPEILYINLKFRFSLWGEKQGGKQEESKRKARGALQLLHLLKFQKYMLKTCFSVEERELIAQR